jgi:hypothetical protein
LGYYDAEVYTTQRHDDLESQVLDGTIGDTQLADRRQTEMLLRNGYMVDAAAHLGAEWQATVGHWEDGQGDPDPWGERRIDLILVSRPVAPALTAYGVLDSEAALAGSDHRIVWATLEPAAISREFGNSEASTSGNTRVVAYGGQEPGEGAWPERRVAVNETAETAGRPYAQLAEASPP